jgi:hypothetical protein
MCNDCWGIGQMYIDRCVERSQRTKDCFRVRVLEVK